MLNFVHKNKNQHIYFVLYIMAKKDKKVNAWQIIAAVFQTLVALFGSLKKSHDSAKQSLRQKRLRIIPRPLLSINKIIQLSYKQSSHAALFSQKQRGAQRQSVTNSAVTFFTKTARRTATKRYKQCSNVFHKNSEAHSDKALQTLQTLHILE